MLSVAVSTALVLSSRIMIFGFFQQRPGNAKTLFLPAGYIDAALPQISVISIRERLYKIVRLCRTAGLLDLLIGSIFISPAQIFL